jgi:hypothetical protein
VDRKVVEVAGHLYVEAPKNRKSRRTIYPRLTPSGYPLAEQLAARAEAARAEQGAGINPLELIFPSPKFKHWRSSNFNRNVLQRAYLAIGWRDADGNGRWTWHSLRHVFCTTAVHLEARRHRRVLHGRTRQRPHHLADVRRHHRRRPRPRPPGHQLTRTRPRRRAGREVCAACVPPGSSSPITEDQHVSHRSRSA